MDNSTLVRETSIEGLVVVTPRVFGDDRGFFLESFNQARYDTLIGQHTFVQDNHSCSQKNTLRGLHFQKAPHAQGKLVRVVQGKAWDVAVDIRPESKTYGQWVGVELSGENSKQFWIPEGFAHGFVTLSDTAEFLYKTTNYYAPQSEGSICWDDPQVGIEWPIEGEVSLSTKDHVAMMLSSAVMFE